MGIHLLVSNQHVITPIYIVVTNIWISYRRPDVPKEASMADVQPCTWVSHL